MSIAFDAGADGFQSGGTNLTYSHTCTGSNLILLVGVWSWQDVHTLTATYAGVSMTSLTTIATDSSGTLQIFGLIAPATGANNIIISSNNTNTQILACSASYTGVKQSGFPDAQTTNTTTATNLTTDLTTIADNTWMFLVSRTPSKLPTAGTNAFRRWFNTASGDAATLFDTNAAQTPAGLHSMNINRSTSGSIYVSMASFAPALPVTNTWNFFSFF